MAKQMLAVAVGVGAVTAVGNYTVFTVPIGRMWRVYVVSFNSEGTMTIASITMVDRHGNGVALWASTPAASGMQLLPVPLEVPQGSTIVAYVDSKAVDGDCFVRLLREDLPA